MPDRHSPSFPRRQQLHMGATLRARFRSWAPHTPRRVSRGRRAASLVLSALVMLATGLWQDWRCWRLPPPAQGYRTWPSAR